MSNELLIPEIKEPAKVFVEGGTKPIADAIKAILDDHSDLDMENPKDRDVMRSMAYSVARSKSYVDNKGKEEVAVIKAKAKVIDAERKWFRETVEEMQREYRKPLTEFEEKEKQRKEAIESRIASIRGLPEALQDATSEAVSSAIEGIENTDFENDFAEFKTDALKARNKVMDTLVEMLQRKIQEEEEKAELERLRKEQAEREAREREERIRQEERERIERERKQAEEEAKAKAEAEKKAQEKALKDAQEREQKAKEEAKRQAEEAARKERERIEAEKRAEEEAKRKREENVKHRKKINNEALQAFVKGGLDEESAKQAVILIASKEIPNVRIDY